jgi:hypothetical protein
MSVLTDDDIRELRDMFMQDRMISDPASAVTYETMARNIERIVLRVMQKKADKFVKTIVESGAMDATHEAVSLMPAGNVMDLVTKLDDRELSGLVETLRTAAAHMDDDPCSPTQGAIVLRELASALCRRRQERTERDGRVFCPEHGERCVACGVHPQEPGALGLCFACDRDEGAE